MTSRFSRLSVLACITALAASLLVSTPAAQAASGGIQVASAKIAYFGDKATFVPVKCASSSKCMGTIGFASTGGTILGPRTYYTIHPNSTVNVKVMLNASYNTEGQAKVVYTEIGPVKRVGAKEVRLEKRAYTTTLKGTISGPAGGGLTDMKVNRYYYSHGRLLLVNSQLVNGNGVWPGGTVPFSFGAVALGNNNAAATEYRLSISAKVDGDKKRYEWFWRGNGVTHTNATATANPIHASPVKATTADSTYGDYSVPFTFGTVTGSVSGLGSAEAEVEVVGAPAAMPTNYTGRKDLDEPYCGDVYGTKTMGNGSYSIPFIPRSNLISPDKRYAIGVTPEAGSNLVPKWNGTYGSCLAARGYNDGVTALKYFPSVTADELNAGATAIDGGLTLRGAVAYQSGSEFTDRKMDIRPYIKGVPMLSSPVLKTFAANAATGKFEVFNIPRGTYWISAGRQESCSAWYPSIYNNNATYFSGEADRTTEIWKSFGRLTSLSGSSTGPGSLPANGYEAIAIQHGATKAQDKVPGGYAGWMYRDVCRTVGAGAYKGINTETPGFDTQNIGLYDKRGATISGKVRREKGKTYKEMMVSAYSTQGVLVGRSAYATSSGSFVIRGLETGNYRIVVNTDSWRGIGRTHSGVQTKYVNRGGSYSVGTLTARF